MQSADYTHPATEHDSTTSGASRPNSSTASVGTYPKHEPELVPATIVVRLVDAHSFRKQANQEREWSDHAVPKPAPKSRRPCIRFFVF
jgi:hypothetical protein